MSDIRRADHWVIVLAGGSGSRLAAVTRADDGLVVPKQYCSLAGGRSLLADALARAALLAPHEHILVVVTQEHEAFWRPELADAGVHVVVQPRDRGTAAGVLLPLLAIAEIDPHARIVMLPSDHYFADEAALAAALLDALDAIRDRAVLIGVPATAPESDYGWILPGPGHTASRPVLAFVEKPEGATAAGLHRRGALWNTMMLVASAPALSNLFGRRQPELLEAFTAYRPHASPVQAAGLYASIDALDFSRDVLQGNETQLDVRVVHGCGWTDLGTPSRLRACIASDQMRHGRSPTSSHARFDLARGLAANAG